MENVRSPKDDSLGYSGKPDVPRGTLASTNLVDWVNRPSANGDKRRDLGEPNVPRGTLGGAKLGKTKQPSVNKRRIAVRGRGSWIVRSLTTTATGSETTSNRVNRPLANGAVG
jgi:hypothetical protein